MARIRSVHPGVWTDEAFVSVSPLARLLAIGIWNECDDQGAFMWKPITLKMRILPADNTDVAALLAELEGADIVRAYEVNGRIYGAVRNFARFQRPKKPNSSHPMPDALRTYAGHDALASEPSDDVNPSGAPPPSVNGTGVPHQFSTASPPVPRKAEMAVQMEETLRKREEESKQESPVRPPTAAPPASDKPAAASRAAHHARQVIPEDWTPDEADRDFARSLGLDPDREAAEFRDYWLGEGTRKASWSAAFRTRCRRQADFQARQLRPKPRRPAQNGAVELLLQAQERAEAEGGRVIDPWGSLPEWHGGH